MSLVCGSQGRLRKRYITLSRLPKLVIILIGKGNREKYFQVEKHHRKYRNETQRSWGNNEVISILVNGAQCMNREG